MIKNTHNHNTHSLQALDILIYVYNNMYKHLFLCSTTQILGSVAFKAL